MEVKSEKLKIKSDVGMSWELARLGDILIYEQPTNYLVSTENYNDAYNIPVLTAGKSFILGYTNENEGIYQNLPAIIFDDFTTDIKYVDFPFKAKSSAMKILTADSSKADIKFLFYWLQTVNFDAGQHKRYWISTFANFQIPLPPLATQKRIAEILDAADALRRKDQELLKKYDELAQAIFIDMFGDPVKNEKGWETKQFKELGTLDRGVSKHRPRNAPELLGGIYPLIQTGDVANSGGIITKHKATYSDLGLKQSKLWEKGTLCITIAANIAKTGILDFDACFPDSIVGFKPNEKISNSKFIQYWIGFLQKILEDNAPESAQKNINLEILRGLDVICPPIELQNEFENKLYKVNSLKNKSSNKIDDDLFESLIQKAFNGELVS
jgi:type I restriction enzyme S subunit